MTKKKETPPTTATLAKRIKALPEGAKEADAYQEFGEGVDRAEFRKVWIEQRVTSQAKAKDDGKRNPDADQPVSDQRKPE